MGSGHGDAIEELKNAFELVEQSCPGISDELVTEVVMRLAGQSMSENECRSAVDRLKGYKLKDNKSLKENTMSTQF